MEQGGVASLSEDGQVAVGQGVGWSPGCLHSYMGVSFIHLPFSWDEAGMYNLISSLLKKCIAFLNKTKKLKVFGWNEIIYKEYA